MKMTRGTLGVAAILIGAATAAQAQVPPPIKELVEIGRGVCPSETKLFARIQNGK